MQIWSSDGVRQERTNWRCQAISGRHREWGYNCPAVDLDFVVAEYNHGLPVALIEYKDRHARPPQLDHATYRALRALADGFAPGDAAIRRQLPFLVAFYDPDEWWFRVTPVNERATAYYRQWTGRPMTEQQFVRSLYLLRKYALTAADEAVIARLSAVVPP